MNHETCSEAVRHPLDKAADAVDGRAALAAVLGVTVTAIGNWKARGTPLEHCIPIERATAGQVRCEDLRPDVDWAYLRGVAPAGSAGDAGPVINPQETRHAA